MRAQVVLKKCSAAIGKVAIKLIESIQELILDSLKTSTYAFNVL